MKYLILLIPFLLVSCNTGKSTEVVDTSQQTVFYTWNARAVTKTVDGNITCYSHSEGGIQCFQINK